MKKTCRLIVVFLLLLVVIISEFTALAVTPDGVLVLGTWNVRGYPEKTPDRSLWFSRELAKIAPDILCLQEIANQADVSCFLKKESGFTLTAFDDSSDGMDNAIFFVDGIQVVDIADPQGFQHAAQAVYFRYHGLDAMLITVHLAWSDTAKRDEERSLLAGVVQEALKVDPDVIVAGDFNTTESIGDRISSLADSLGLRILVSDNPGIGTTYAGKNYDFILVSPDLADEESLGSHIIEFDALDVGVAKAVSDHRPVIARFRTDQQYSDCRIWPPESLLSFSWGTNGTLVSTSPVCLSCLDALNSASYEDFRAVDGIGDTLARRLVAAKPYPSIDSLDNVHGIGPVKMRAILDSLCTD